PGHPRYIEPIKAKEIIDWLSGPVMVAELGALLPEQTQSALEVLGIKTVQLNNKEAAREWIKAGYEVIWEGTEALEEGLLCLCKPHETTTPDKVILDLSDSSLEEIEQRWVKNPPLAIQLTGGDESAPGIRDFADIDEILELFEL